MLNPTWTSQVPKMMARYPLLWDTSCNFAYFGGPGFRSCKRQTHCLHKLQNPREELLAKPLAPAAHSAFLELFQSGPGVQWKWRGLQNQSRVLSVVRSYAGVRHVSVCVGFGSHGKSHWNSASTSLPRSFSAGCCCCHQRNDHCDSEYAQNICSLEVLVQNRGNGRK